MFGGDSYTYDTRTADPCEVTVTLDGPSGADFDLYATLDGRTPSPGDADRSSNGAGADERLVLEALDGVDRVGVLVDPASGYGEYTLEVEELSR